MQSKNAIVYGLLLAVAPGVTATADAEVRYVDVAASTGLDFVVEPGETFDFGGFPEKVAETLEILQRNMGHGVAVGDYDKDGDQDVYVLGGLGLPNTLFRNEFESGELRFVDVTEEAGLQNLGLGRIAMFADLDNDGWRDVVLLNDTTSRESHPPSAVYRNNMDGTFTDVTKGSGFTPLGYIKGGLGVGDYDKDGLLDLYVANWGARQSDGTILLEGHNRLYRNLGDFRFEDVTEASGLGIFSSNSFTPILADFDRDFDLDLFVAVDGYSDVYYENLDGTFVDRTVEVGATHVATDSGVGARDFDLDGDLDLFCSNATHPDDDWGGNTLLVNQLVETGTMTFVDEARTRGVFNTGWGWGADWIDADNDTFPDLFAVNGFDEFVLASQPPDIAERLIDVPSFLLLNDGTGQFTATAGTGAEVVGDSRVAFGLDVDRDGDEDLIMTSMGEPIVLLRNDTSPRGRWFEARLVGRYCVNADAIGSRLEVSFGGRTYIQEIIGGGSYLAGLPVELRFGLGDANRIDEIVAVWPDGTTNVARDWAADDRLLGVLSISGDISGDGRVDFGDILLILKDWGPCPEEPCPGDINGDDVVDVADLLAILSNWGRKASCF